MNKYKMILKALPALASMFFSLASLKIRVAIGKSWRLCKEFFLGRSSFKDYSYEHMKGFYYINRGENVVSLTPDESFRESLKEVGIKLIEPKILKPYDHCWVDNNYLIVTTDDGKNATLGMAYTHKDLKEVKRKLRMERKKQPHSAVVSI